MLEKKSKGLVVVVWGAMVEGDGEKGDVRPPKQQQQLEIGFVIKPLAARQSVSTTTTTTT